MLGEILTAIVTPFRPDGSVDLERFRALASHLVENGSDGLVVTGTTGESPTLSDEERFALYEAAVDEVGDRATVIAVVSMTRSSTTCSISHFWLSNCCSNCERGSLKKSPISTPLA